MNAVGCHTSTLVLSLLLVLSVTIQYVVSTREQNSENLFPFLGYLQGFKLGQNFALELPPLLLSPIVIVKPSMNLYHGLLAEPNNHENDENNDYHTRNTSYSKLSSIFFNKTDIMNDEKIKEPIEKDLHVKEKRLAGTDTATDSLRQAVGDKSDTDRTTEINEVLSTTSTSEFNYSTTENIIRINETTIVPGPYPSALYNNDFIKNLTITSQQIGNNFTLPSKDNNWQNFSLSSNISVVLSNTNGTNNTTEAAIFPTTQSSVITNLYPYPNSIFNSMVDRLSITTNPYLDQSNLPPSYDDRWQSFSSLTKLYPNSGFRPLAGLYYDGFLHKSLNKKTGFMPFEGNNYDYE